jgi:hypothetical protein
MIKRKTRDWKRIQQGGIMEYGEAATQVAAEASVAALWKLQRDWTLRANVQKDTEASFESGASTTYVGSLFDSNEVEES